MDDAFRVPDARLARMIADWPTFDDAEIERVANEIPLGSRISDARMWMAQCRTMLPMDHTIMSDYRVLVMLDGASVKTTQEGIAGRNYLFRDGSRIVANNRGDRVYGS